MITIKYFANLREIAGKSEEQIDSGELTFESFCKLIEQSQPKIAELIRQKNILVSVNHDIAGIDTMNIRYLPERPEIAPGRLE